MEVNVLSEPSAARPCQVRVLGPLDVSVGGHAIELGGQKQRLVLALLAARGGAVVGREALTDALWPTAPPASARHTIEAYVSRLRRALRAAGVDGAIEGGSGGYRLRLDACELDWHRFERLAEIGTAAQEARDPAVAADAFAAALDLWRGAAFAGFDGSIALRSEAAMLADFRLQVLERWAETQLELGNPAALVRRLRSAVGEHPSRERLHELLMTGLFRSGDQVGALAVFRDLRAHLADEFGLEPGEAMRALQQRVLRQDPSLASTSLDRSIAAAEPVDASGAAIPGPLRPCPSAFVGRAAQLARCHDRLRDCVATGRLQLLLIGGAPGMGKSRLCKEFAQGAEATVLYGRAEREQLLPLQPFAEALQHHTSTCSDEELQRQVLSAGGELSRIVTDLPVRVPGLSAPLAGDPDGARIRLFIAIERLFRAATRPGPLVLVLDDLHWADPLSLMLLKFLVRRLENAPVLIVGTYRTTEVDAGHPLVGTVSDLRADCTPVRLELEPLRAADIAALVQDRAGRPVPARVHDTLFEATEGNPLVAIEMLRHTLDDAGSVLEVSPGLRELIADRLDRLDESVRGILSGPRIAPGPA